jgi:nucleotide-binding universal stress UspA family protein
LDDRVVLSVADQGPGIPAEQRERIFEDYSQVGTQPEGTGLGLSVSRRLAKLMGGDLWVETEVERGSTFRVALPSSSAALAVAASWQAVLPVEGRSTLTPDRPRPKTGLANQPRRQITVTGQDSIKKIVVGVDGSVQAGQALAWAIRLAQASRAEIIAVLAIPPPSYYEFGAGYGVPVVPAELDPEWRAEMRHDFELKWCAPLAHSGLGYRLVVRDGRPAAVIGSLADEEEADLVVVGRRGRGGVAEMLLGSVSHELSHHCKHPVLLFSRQPVAAKPLTVVGSTSA